MALMPPFKLFLFLISYWKQATTVVRFINSWSLLLRLQMLFTQQIEASSMPTEWEYCLICTIVCKNKLIVLGFMNYFLDK